MHVTGASTALMATLAMASSASARAILYRPEARAPQPTGAAMDKRQASSSSVSIVTTMPVPTTTPQPEGIWSTASPKPFSYGQPDPEFFGVKGRGKNGATNPEEPKLDTPVNQSSESRLATINSIDDWCTFGPKEFNNTEPLGNIEQDVVAYCTKPRNGARVIPDGTITGVQFVKTPLYVQLYAVGDFTKINLVAGDEGGELDPHGATNQGNPIGGNVTTNIMDGKTDVFYEEWMNYVSSDQVCFRICTAGNEEATPGAVCQHELDVMGCQWVMAQKTVQPDTWESCESEAAWPPGWYPQPDGSTSTFHQFYEGVYTVGATAYSYRNAREDQNTPSLAYSYPTLSNCQTTSSFGNGLKGIDFVAPPSSTVPLSSSATGSATGSVSGSPSSGSGSNSANAAGGGVNNNASGDQKSSGSKTTAFGGVVAFVAALGAGVALL